MRSDGSVESSPEPGELQQRQKRRGYIVEMVMGAFLVLVFVAMALQSLQWPREAAVFPRLISGLGILFTVLYMGQQWIRHRRRTVQSQAQAKVLDIPWAKVTADAAYVRRTALIAVASMLVFWAGIVLVGFHVAAPLYLYSQLVLLGGLRHWQALLSAAIILAVVVLVYGRLVGTTWNDPLLWDWARSLWEARS